MRWRRTQKTTNGVTDKCYRLRRGKWVSEIRPKSSVMCALFYEATFRHIENGTEGDPIRERHLDHLKGAAQQQLVRLEDWEKLK